MNTVNRVYWERKDAFGVRFDKCAEASDADDGHNGRYVLRVWSGV